MGVLKLMRTCCGAFTSPCGLKVATLAAWLNKGASSSTPASRVFMMEARKMQAAIIPDIHPACDISISKSRLAGKKMPHAGAMPVS